MTTVRSFIDVKRGALARAVPLGAHLELTYRCQWRCVFCCNSRHEDRAALSLDEWCGVLDDLRELGTLSVTLTGGDPLLHDDFWGIAEAVRQRAFALRVFTNGSRVTDEAASRLADLRALSVELSLHGATAAVHDRTTGRPGSFEQVWAAVSVLRQRGLAVVLKTVLTSMNAAELAAVITLAAEREIPLRVDPAISPGYDGDRSPLRFRPPPPAVEALMRRLAEDGRVPTVGPRLLGDTNCGLGRLTVVIDPEGEVFPCVQWRHQPLGNVRERPLAALWAQSSSARECLYGIAVAANDRLCRMAGPLAAYPFCPGVALQVTGDPSEPDPLFITNALAAGLARPRTPPAPSPAAAPPSVTASSPPSDR